MSNVNDLRIRQDSALERNGMELWKWEQFLSSPKQLGMIFNKREPGGQFMSTIENAVESLGKAKQSIMDASRNFQESAKTAAKGALDASGKLRDGSEKLGSALDKLMKVSGRADFAETVKLTGQLVESLERLAALEEKGLLDKVMKAMQK